MLVSLTIILSGVVNAQKIKLVSGNLDFLKGQTSLKIEYDYGNGDMDVGRYENEADYIVDKIKEKNEIEPGSGDKWYKEWFNDRERRFQPRFEEFLNEELEKSGVTIWPESENAKYTLILKTTSTEPGWKGFTRGYVTVGVLAWINVDVIFIETDKPEKELAKIIIEKATQKGKYKKGASGYDVAYRIEYAYANCGQILGKYLAKKVFK